MLVGEKGPLSIVNSHISHFQTQQVSVGKRNEQFEPGAKYAWSMF